MARRSGHGRAGFSLIELLVVISILAIMMGILVSAVMKVNIVGPRADTTSRIAGINNAVGTFKSERNVPFIPGGSIDINTASGTFGQVVGPFRLRNSYPATTTGGEPDQNSFEAQYIVRLFPRANLLGLGNTTFDTNKPNLDANQTLLFFLNGIQIANGQGGVAFRGFSKNPQQPFEQGSVGDNRSGPYLDISNKHYTTSTPNGFAWLTDGWKRPFAYFAAYNGKPVKSAGQYGGKNDQFPSPMGTPIAYQNGNTFANESGYQIISAGNDGIFGTSGSWTSVGPAGQDDRANFSNSNLGAGPN